MAKANTKGPDKARPKPKARLASRPRVRRFAPRWIVWDDAGAPRRFNALPHFGILESGGKFLHNGGPAYMIIPDDAVILRDYGPVRQSTPYKRFEKDFPPQEGTVEDLVETCCGWLAPDGRLFVCYYAAHATLAIRLCAMHDMSEDRKDGWGNRLHSGVFAQNALLDKRWVYVSPHYVLHQQDRLRKPQLRRLADILAALKGVEDTTAAASRVAALRQTRIKELSKEIGFILSEET